MRPHVFGLAQNFGLAGFVRNDGFGVTIEIEGARAEEFCDELPQNLPPLARLDRMNREFLPARGEKIFVIAESAESAESSKGGASARIPPDAATCPACQRDIFDPASRFHNYPFTTCTHCGPRYTLTYGLPYDRAKTTMQSFALCPDCASDYQNPGNRRFHAEPIACPACGPKLSHELSEVAAALHAQKIVALKGIGGFHLLCDAISEPTIQRLRQLKNRDQKPFAVMVANTEILAEIATPTPDEIKLLQSAAAPAVLVASRQNLPEALAPGLKKLGVMLAYAPVHHLLFAAGAPKFLVATSANPGGAPLIADNDEAEQKLKNIADLIVTHDRAIATRADDSVMQIVAGAPSFLRRARGFVPEPIDLGADGPSVLACGGHLKATLCVTRGREAFLTPHIGDLSNTENFRFFRESAAHLLKLLDVKPEAAACDLHPDYLSTRFAEQTGLPVLRLQHHAAHIAAIAAENFETKNMLGLALDGHGLGEDGEAPGVGSWGGELLKLNGQGGADRLAHLKPLKIFGGDRAAREPLRMALSAFGALGRLNEAESFFPDTPAGELIKIFAHRPSPQTTSAGRLFDAAAALLGFWRPQAYEGEAAMRLEALVETPRFDTKLFKIADKTLDFSPLLATLIDQKPGPKQGAELVHGALIDGFAALVQTQAEPDEKIALSGGCLMNKVLAEGLHEKLSQAGLKPVLAQKAPPNDGGLSLGQAFLARQILTKT